MTLPDAASRDTLRGILWMLFAMFAFATEDVLIKLVAATVPTAQILAILGIAGAAVFWAWARAQGHRVLGPDLLLAPILARNAGEGFGTVCFVSALALIPLSTLSAILQATPLAVTLGAALVFGAQVGWRRWSAIAVGLVGVLLILRPGTDAFEPAALLALGAVIGLSVRDLATRAAPARIPSQVLAAQSFAAVGLVGLAALPFGAPPVRPDPGAVAALAGAVAIGTVAYYAITQAMRMGDITAITPFRYSRILFALVYGVLLFGERPDALTLAGAALVVGSGLYSLVRERRRAARTV